MPIIITASRSAPERRPATLVLLLVLLPGAAAADGAAPLAPFEIGAYAELASRPNPADYAIVFVPSLVSVLRAAEEGRGAPLDEAEALALRDRAGAMAVPPDRARGLEDGRGYRDLDPDRCWQDWRTRREELITP